MAKKPAPAPKAAPKVAGAPQASAPQPPPPQNGHAQDMHGAAMAAAATAGAPYISNAAPMPLVPGKAVALNRAGLPVQRAAAETGVNAFFVPPHLPPAGWSWEWKRESVRGQADPYYISRLKQVAWEPVRYESYPGVFAPEYDEHGKPWVGPVRREGLMLMERPANLTKEAQDEEIAKAKRRSNDARNQYTRLNTDGTSTAEIDLEARRASYIKQQHEPMPQMPPSANAGIKVE